MSLSRHFSTCYPLYSNAIEAVIRCPLATRSILIKCCQAQHAFRPDSDAPLARLLKKCPPIVFPSRNSKGAQKYIVLEAINFFGHFNISPSDALESAILLDILRGIPPVNTDVVRFRTKGWNTEIQLSEGLAYPDIDFFPLFFNFPRPIHKNLPYNPQSAFYIRRTFERFRDTLIRSSRMYYPRSTHKNMSRSTRRDYEEKIGGNLCILEPDIFGQDDWQRVYHDTGIQLGGVVEMRQKWYPSGAKPRTYFAMGGICYRDSRFLQDFFTDLVNLFPSTNHITRLRPDLLELEDDQSAFLVYDLSSFTSNMRQQRSFCAAMTEFFRGVEITIVDERDGPCRVDLGDLLHQYCLTCVNGPRLSYERSPQSMGWSHLTNQKHGIASLLGIFGNLMTCTLAHFMTVSPTLVDPAKENETAGDDGLTPVRDDYRDTVYRCIGFVGDFAEEKLFLSTDEGAVCLKRPLLTDGRRLLLGKNCVPPTMATCVAYLSGTNSDPRYTIYGIEEMSVPERVSVVGVDLLRFLRSAYENLPHDNLERLDQIVRGFTRMRDSIMNPYAEPGRAKEIRKGIWPLLPSSYTFFGSEEPFLVWAKYHVRCFECPVTEVAPIPFGKLRYSGDSFKGNSDRRLGLLEKLGYMVKEEVRSMMLGPKAAVAWYAWFNLRAKLAPPVYSYKCIRDVPDQFLF